MQEKERRFNAKPKVDSLSIQVPSSVSERKVVTTRTVVAEANVQVCRFCLCS